MRSKLLIVGSNGLLGSYFRDLLPKQLSIFTHNQPSISSIISYDLKSPLSSLNLNWNSISRIILCAGISKPVLCENNPELSYLVNYKAPLDLIRFANSQDIPVTLFSSEYVFNGFSDSPYLETSAKCPSTIYGHHKALLEDKLSSSDLDYTCFRISKLASVTYQRSFLSKMLADLHTGTYKAAVDQIFSPIDLSEAVYLILKSHFLGLKGLYNLSGSLTISRYDLACQLKCSFNINTQITPIKLSDLTSNYKIGPNLVLSPQLLSSIINEPTRPFTLV